MKKELTPALAFVLIALLGAASIPLGVIYGIYYMEFGTLMQPPVFIPLMAMCFVVIAALSYIVIHKAEKEGNGVITLIRALLINCCALIITSFILYLFTSSLNAGKLIIIYTLISAAIVIGAIFAGYLAVIISSNKTFSERKKFNTCNYLYAVIFAAIMLLLIFSCVMIRSVKEITLTDNSLNAFFQAGAIAAFFIIIALSIALPIIAVLIIKTNKHALNNAFVFIPAICLLGGIIIECIINKDFTLWVMLYVAPALASIIFNKLIVDDCKNNTIC